MVVGATLGSVPALAEEVSVEGYSAWSARGQIFPTGASESTFVGALSGVLIVKGEDGSIDAGEIVCPGSLVINTDDASQVGNGKCIIITPDGERVFGEFSCHGEFGQGCDGEFTLTGGTGEKAGIAGGGPIRIRRISSSLMQDRSGNIIEQSLAGIAYWPSLTYQLP
jgi:hypothetical protein